MDRMPARHSRSAYPRLRLALLTVLALPVLLLLAQGRVGRVAGQTPTGDPAGQRPPVAATPTPTPGAPAPHGLHAGLAGQLAATRLCRWS